MIQQSTHARQDSNPIRPPWMPFLQKELVFRKRTGALGTLVTL